MRDLRSVVIVAVKRFDVGQQVTLRLMSRRRHATLTVPADEMPQLREGIGGYVSPVCISSCL